jgi:glycosyltransferase involved in cell wall biosynthesis
MRPFRRALESEFTHLDAATLESGRRRWFTDGRPTLLYAGRLGQEKNLDFLLTVFAALRIRQPDVRLVLAGDGPSRSTLEQAAAGQKPGASHPAMPRAWSMAHATPLPTHDESPSWS